jgi:hypothetical protein
VGFPCTTGDEFAWCCHLSAQDDIMELAPARSREELAFSQERWLQKLMRRWGRPAATLWLMHESPAGPPIACREAVNPGWTEAVLRYSPRLVVCGHDHRKPLETGIWSAKIGPSLCVNVGQSVSELHYCVVDFDFETATSPQPTRIGVNAFPWNLSLR